MTVTQTTPALHMEFRDDSVRIQDDLYRHVNGTWLKNTPIPEDKPSWGVFNALREASQEAVKDIIMSLADGAEKGTAAQQIHDLYAAYMNVDQINKLGAKPLQPLLAQVDAVENVDQLLELLGLLLYQGYGNLFGLGTDADPENPQQYVAFIGQGGLGLPDEAYYRLDEHKDLRKAYVQHIEKLLELCGVDQPKIQAQMTFALETELASFHWDRVTCRDIVKSVNPMSLDQLEASCPGIKRMFIPSGLDLSKLERIIVGQPSFFESLGKTFDEDHLEAWKAWARTSICASRAMLLSDEIVAERFNFVGTTLSGTPAMEERWKRAVSFIENTMLSEAVGKLYVEKYFPPEAKARTLELVDWLLKAYEASIKDLQWMSEDTKAEALNKLAKFTPKVGYPDTWRDFSALDICADDLLGNVCRIHAFHFDFELNRCLQPVDRDEWQMSPQTVNAYYHPLRNEICFPAAILQPPFFHKDGDDAVNFGGIGAVIGHEIGHGFDDQGSTCDGDGRLRNWWTEQDLAAFKERTKLLIDQYDVLHPEEAPDVHVNGALTIGENIGDLGGLSIALKAWQMATEGQDVPEIDGLTGLQRLFWSWATVWQANTRPETMRLRVANDPHSPNEFRANQIVKNIDAFYEAFDVKETDQMYLEPEKRVTIW